ARPQEVRCRRARVPFPGDDRPPGKGRDPPNLPASGETYLATPFGARRRRRATATIAEPIARTARPMTTSCERKAPVNAIATGALGELGGGALTTAAGGVVTGLVTGGAVTVVVTVF